MKDGPHSPPAATDTWMDLPNGVGVQQHGTIIITVTMTHSKDATKLPYVARFFMITELPPAVSLSNACMASYMGLRTYSDRSLSDVFPIFKSLRRRTAGVIEGCRSSTIIIYDLALGWLG
ncbi:hypothetical protein Vretimale_2512 [Volvox reticuliferus]|uniref:Uncharacterized protein n=1 Tax=Volvox reticuliferus TaxID=1737510 RepID=A0A8J4C3Y6_9CHLO|nr:hypothetical protein Vretifemale_4875 [Volvox reticuliferus]GIL96839.1 hypothetical protein Vretimale_2512 [Volvox reticuliferus]